VQPYSPRIARAAEGRSRKSKDAAAEVRGEKALQQTAANHPERDPLATTLGPGRASRSALLQMAIRITARGSAYGTTSYGAGRWATYHCQGNLDQAPPVGTVVACLNCDHHHDDTGLEAEARLYGAAALKASLRTAAPSPCPANFRIA
jgi:hypothetical protein